MDLFQHIAEARIQEAVDAGFFDDLALAGQPLPGEDLCGVPAELRMAYRVLRNAGMLPEEMELKRELVHLRDLLAACTDEAEGQRLQRRITARSLRYQILMERRGANAADHQYGGRI